MVAHLQQYSGAYQALVSEREQLHQQYLQQSQLMDRLQHDESHNRAQLDISYNQLRQAQVCTAQIISSFFFYNIVKPRKKKTSKTNLELHTDTDHCFHCIHIFCV